MRWNQVDIILHRGLLDVLTKFGDDRTKFHLNLEDSLRKREPKTRLAGLEMGLLTLYMMR